jgi:membrane-associated PAP2 superfamily phosphatase
MKYLPFLYFSLYSIRFYSTQSTNSGVLLRDWIHDSLYHPQKGYFTKHAQILQPINHDKDIDLKVFSSFSNREDYLYWLKNVFRYINL